MAQNDWHQKFWLDFNAEWSNLWLVSYSSTISLNMFEPWLSGWWIKIWISSIIQKICNVILYTIPAENSLTHVYLPAIHVDQISWHLVLLVDHKGPPPLHHSCPQRGPTWPIPCNKFGETDQGTIRTLAILTKNTQQRWSLQMWVKFPKSASKIHGETKTTTQNPKVSMSGHHMPIALHLRETRSY